MQRHKHRRQGPHSRSKERHAVPPSSSGTGVGEQRQRQRQRQRCSAHLAMCVCPRQRSVGCRLLRCCWGAAIAANLEGRLGGFHHPPRAAPVRICRCIRRRRWRRHRAGWQGRPRCCVCCRHVLKRGRWWPLRRQHALHRRLLRRLLCRRTGSLCRRCLGHRSCCCCWASLAPQAGALLGPAERKQGADTLVS